MKLLLTKWCMEVTFLQLWGLLDTLHPKMTLRYRQLEILITSWKKRPRYISKFFTSFEWKKDISFLFLDFFAQNSFELNYFLWIFSQNSFRLRYHFHKFFFGIPLFKIFLGSDIIYSEFFSQLFLKILDRANFDFVIFECASF